MSMPIHTHMQAYHDVISRAFRYGGVSPWEGHLNDRHNMNLTATSCKDFIYPHNDNGFYLHVLERS